MKFQFIYTFFALALGAYLFMGSSNGAGAVQSIDLTGSPLGGGIFCSFCHSGGSFSPSIAVQVLDNGTPVTVYEPGKTYSLRVAITAGAGSPLRYGFMAVALTGATNQGAGTFGTPPTGMRKTTISNRVYVEHNTPSVANTFEVEWTAPVAGTGDVRLYSAGNATNNNNGTTGDNAVRLPTPLTLTEMATSNLTTTQLFRQLSAWPNPVSDELNIRIVTAKSGLFKMEVLDAQGRWLRSEQVQLAAGENNLRRDWNAAMPGVYFVQFSDGEGLATLRVLKR
ncbi:MAG: choice-of-anchor V domain-containing protein [Saprospiraceae bacterium]|nr:choice-of-anchor V domain-containing protein [Saprospiraceae bacterium]MDZ4702687.1 choice-of-anchor V domain-containing protein [Saprospiraceae bacterium]